MKRCRYKRNKTKRYFINKCVEKLKYCATHYELLFKVLLDALNIKYEFQKLLWGNKIVDFYLPEYRIIIEIDGEYHNTTHQKKKDLYRDTNFYLGSIKVIRFKNKEVLDTKFITDKLCKVVLM